MADNQQGRPYDFKRYKYIIENIKDAVWEMDLNYVYTFVSPNAKAMTGYEVEEMVGRKMPDFLTEESRNYVYGVARQHLKKRIDGDKTEVISQDIQFVCRNGLVKWLEISASPRFEEGKFLGYIGTTRDITEKKEYERQLNQYIEELKTVNAKLEKMATVDALTGIYNRRKFDGDLDSITKHQEKYNTLSLILFDIDNFKTINDDYGHKTGDMVLQCIAKLVSENIRVTDGLFRWGGDEFILILPDVNLESANKVAEKLRSIIQDHDFGIGHKITISLGVSEYKPNENNEQIIVRIDNALLKAKSRGKNRVIAC